MLGQPVEVSGESVDLCAVGLTRRNFSLAVCNLIVAAGCGSGTGSSSDQAIADDREPGKITWGIAKSEEFHARLCSTTDVFSTRLEFGDGSSMIAPEIRERVVCGMPRSRAEPKSFEVTGDIIGIAYDRAGKIVNRCRPASGSDSTGNLSDSAASKFDCSGLTPDMIMPDVGPAGEPVSLNLRDFSDSTGTVRTAELNLEIARVSDIGTVQLIVPPGTYRIQDAIRSDGSINLLGAGMGVSKIIGTDLEMRSILEVNPSYQERLELSVTADHGSNVLFVSGVPQDQWQSSCSRIVIRDRSQVWPWDARDYVFFGEVANVVRAGQGLVVLAEPTSDTYFRGADVSFLCPSSVVIQDISLEFENSVLGTKALSISGADPVSIINVEVKNSGRVAIWIAESANVLVSGSTLSDGFPLDCDTCYGIQTYGAQDVLLRDNSITGFRRAIDISGTIPSRRVVVQDNYVRAESDTIRAASGMGTHGSAEGVIFADNDVIGGIVSLLLRGNEILASNNRFVDAEYSSIYLDSGATHYLDGNQLGGTRANGRPTIRGIEFHVTTEHLYCGITNNVVSASVGVRIAETPGQIEVTKNRMEIDGIPVLVEGNVELDADDTVEFEW